MIQTLKPILLIAGWLMVAMTTHAETLIIKGVGLQFKPQVIFVEKGDTVAFEQMATHFVESIMIPEGANKMLSDMGADYTYNIDKEGLYLYKCPPHWGARMGGIIVVGTDLRDKEKLIDSLKEYKTLAKKSKDKMSKGYLKKIIKNIKKGKIKLPK